MVMRHCSLRYWKPATANGSRHNNREEEKHAMSIASQSIDLILHNARIYTVDEQDSIAEAIAIHKGYIVGVGTSREILALAGDTTRVIDLQQKTVVPGFVDAHPHLDTVGMRLTRPVFNNAKSIQDVLEVIRREVAKAEPGQWIICNPIADERDVFSYPEALAEGRWPTRHELDTVSPNHRVNIERAQLSAPGYGLASDLALQAPGITESTPTPEGVDILLDEAGEPNGIFRDIFFPTKIPVFDIAFRAR